MIQIKYVENKPKINKLCLNINITKKHLTEIVTGINTKFNVKNRLQIAIASSCIPILLVSPQSSIRGPLLLIGIYINDIAQASKLFDFIICVDDTIGSITRNCQLKHTKSNR